MLKIGLTGGIGSGKSSVSTLLKEWGAYIFDADTVGKDILAKDTTAQSEIIAEFGTDVLGADEKIDKKKLSRIAFQDEDHQLRLNTIVHPYVFREIDSDYDAILGKGKYDIFIVDAALIYESGANTHMDYIIVVTSHLKLRTERVLSLGQLSRDEFFKRMELQWPDETKVHMADFVIHNNGTPIDLEKETKMVFDKLI